MIETKLFKWVGGKKWLAPRLNELYKNKITKNKYKYYIEPFAGGLGSLLFVLPTLEEKGIDTIIINDINKTLINTYKSIKSKKNKVFKTYWNLEKEYKKLIPKKAFKLNPTKDKKELRNLLDDASKYFYFCRDRFNEIKDSSDVEAVALFLFLAQHSFNGLYRENQAGGYNTPYNWETACPERKKKKDLIDSYSSIFKKFNIIFENKDVFKFINKYKKYSKEAVFYFDPPYLNEDIPENKYNKDHFCSKSQNKLLKEYLSLDNFIFSNHMLDFFSDFCEKNNVKYETVYRSNVMNRDISKRKEKIAEILAYNI